MSETKAIIQFHCAGRTNSEIIKLLWPNPNFIMKIFKQLSFRSEDHALIDKRRLFPGKGEDESEETNGQRHECETDRDILQMGKKVHS